MTASPLGLPLEYQQYPQYFDSWNIQADTDAKNAVVEQLLRAHKVRSVADFTCGTGCQVFYLTDRGYAVVGADFSPALLEIAREKARARGIPLQFVDGDMRHVQLGQFDAAISMFNAIGHLTKPDFAQALRNICSQLKAGGIYVFDILNLAAMTAEGVAALAMDEQHVIGNMRIHHRQRSVLEAGGRLTSYDHHVFCEGDAPPKTVESCFSLQLYTARELREMLAAAGFNKVEQCAMDGTPLKDNSKSILTVATTPAS